MEPEPGSDEKKSGANRPEVTNNGAIVERIAGDNNTVIGSSYFLYSMVSVC